MVGIKGIMGRKIICLLKQPSFLWRMVVFYIDVDEGLSPIEKG
jgi:hypothetical protein